MTEQINSLGISDGSLAHVSWSLGSLLFAVVLHAKKATIAENTRILLRSARDSLIQGLAWKKKRRCLSETEVIL